VTTIETPSADTSVDEEVALAEASAEAYRKLLSRLSHQSVVKHFDAYADIAWDDPRYAVDADDDRWGLNDDDPLARTSWYQGLAPDRRRRLVLDLTASKMKTGLQFESVLKRGLLEFAFELPNGSPEFRYAYHEVIEEAQHALMFQEFVNRSGYPAAGLSRSDAFAARQVSSLGRRFPALFFIFVLGGEDPVDHMQRQILRSGKELPPILERIMRIHVTEEARHLSFARHYLKRTVPQLSRTRRAVLAVGAPLILSQMAAVMMQPDKGIVRRHQIPDEVVRDAFTESDAHRAEVMASLRKVRQLCTELGLLRQPYKQLWKKLDLI
jgi:hypothetical protein